jgi:hypothetical protein
LEKKAAIKMRKTKELGAVGFATIFPLATDPGWIPSGVNLNKSKDWNGKW